MSAAGAIGASVTNPSPLAATMLEELQKAYAPYPAIVSAEAIKRGEALVERWAAERDALEQKALMIQDERDELLALRDGRVSEALPKGVTGPAGDSTTSVLMEPHAARPSGDQKNCDHDWEDKSVMRDVCRKCGKEEMA